MKTIALWFLTGFIVAALAVSLFSRRNWVLVAHADENKTETKAEKKSDSKEGISSLNTKVPNSAELEAGLGQKEKELKEREEKIKAQEDLLAVEENRLKVRVDELEKLRSEMDGDKKKFDRRKDEEFKRLVKTYEAMSPKKASGVVSIMEDTLAVDLLLAMKEKKVSEILNVMEPNRAMTLSALLARRKPAAASKGSE